MKYLLLITLITVVCASPVLAQNRLELYADVNHSTCSISEPVSPPIVQVHIFLVGPTASTGVRFTAPKPACWVGATWLGDVILEGASAGNSQTDWSVAFGRCVPSPAYVGAISYLISGQALACCEVNATPTLSYDHFEYTDCPPTFAEHRLAASKPLVVNPDESCGCQSGITTAVENSTWGRVKSLYR